MLQANPFPYTASFKTLGNPELTTPTGGFSFPVLGLLENAQLRVQTLGPPTVTSPVLLENVAIQVTFHARRTHHHERLRLYGTLTPAETGAQVGFQLLILGGRSASEAIMYETECMIRSGTCSVSFAYVAIQLWSTFTLWGGLSLGKLIRPSRVRTRALLCV